MTNIHVLPDVKSLAEAAADQIITIADAAIKATDSFSLVLSGGVTPRPMYQLLATDAYKSRIDWEKVIIFWGDERCVPPDDDESCYKMARQTLLDHVPVLPNNIHRMRGEIRPDEAAAEYEALLRGIFKSDRPRFDLILLGIGDDGHTASLFPRTNALHEEQRWVTENYVPAKQAWRITFTRPGINGAANIMFVVSGKNKAERLKQITSGEYQPYDLPAQLVKPTHGNLSWFIDAEAAAQL